MKIDEARAYRDARREQEGGQPTSCCNPWGL